MQSIILFDQDVQHYRIPIYKKFDVIFQEKFGLSLVVLYDNTNNNLTEEGGVFKGINYSFRSFTNEIKKYKPKIIIQFVWLRYKFLIPFMLWSKTKGIKIILWSHGINLQNKKQLLKNQLYYLRQKLANALIIYTPEQIKYLKVKNQKVFIANNTLDFDSLPKITKSKTGLLLKYNFKNKKIILCVGRMNTNNRKIDHLIKLSRLISDDLKIIIIGPGVDEESVIKINSLTNIEYLGPIYNQEILSEYYKLSEVFVMPGAIGLAINQALYYETPVIIEDVDQGPEAFYLKDGINGFYYKKGNINDLKEKIELLMERNNYQGFCDNAKETIKAEVSLDKMTQGFIRAINYLVGN